MTRTNLIAFDKKHIDDKVMLTYTVHSMMTLPPCNL